MYTPRVLPTTRVCLEGPSSSPPKTPHRSSSAQIRWAGEAPGDPVRGAGPPGGCAHGAAGLQVETPVLFPPSPLILVYSTVFSEK
jgi:hypothetical protein